MTGNARFSSIGSAVASAAEAAVKQLEENDVAMREDALRELYAYTKRAYDTQRLKSKMLMHPTAKDLVDGVAMDTPTTAFKDLMDSMIVQEHECSYDDDRNVTMTTTVVWQRPNNSQHKNKKRKKAVEDNSTELIVKYEFARYKAATAIESDENDDNDDSAILTHVHFKVSVGFGVHTKQELWAEIELQTPSEYPREMYESNFDDDPESHRDSSMSATSAENDRFGEQVTNFHFEGKTVLEIVEWLDLQDQEPSDIIAFLLAFPACEDEWSLDDRICEMLFASDESEEE